VEPKGTQAICPPAFKGICTSAARAGPPLVLPPSWVCCSGGRVLSLGLVLDVTKQLFGQIGAASLSNIHSPCSTTAVRALSASPCCFVTCSDVLGQRPLSHRRSFWADTDSQGLCRDEGESLLLHQRGQSYKSKTKARCSESFLSYSLSDFSGSLLNARI